MAIHLHIWFCWLIVVAIQIPTTCAWSVIYNSMRLYGEKCALEHSLTLHLSPTRVQQIQDRPELLKPGAEEQEVSILFSDIANFTAMSEGMDPRDLARNMNDYFEKAVNKCIHPTHGTVVTYIGDAIFAIWNAPTPLENHEILALRGALLLRDNVKSCFQDIKIKQTIRTIGRQ